MSYIETRRVYCYVWLLLWGVVVICDLYTQEAREAVPKEAAIQTNIAKSIIKLASSIDHDELVAVHAAIGQVISITIHVWIDGLLIPQMLQSHAEPDPQQQIPQASKSSVKKEVKQIASNMMKLETYYSNIYQQSN